MGTSFNGIMIKKGDDGTVRITEEDTIQKLKAATNDKQFASQLAAEEYAGVNLRPYRCSKMQLMEPGNETPYQANTRS